MSKDFKFWQLYKRQWSWNNDKFNLLIYFTISLLLISTYHFTGSIQVAPLGYYWYGLGRAFLTLFIFTGMIYQSIKAFMMLLFCILVTYMANKGDTKAMQTYAEALIWRQ